MYELEPRFVLVRRAESTRPEYPTTVEILKGIVDIRTTSPLLGAMAVGGGLVGGIWLAWQLLKPAK